MRHEFDEASQVDKIAIETEKAPSAIGIYSQAIAVGNVVYVSGQIPLDPETGICETNDFQKAAHQVFRNLAAVCEAAGGKLDSIVKLTVYLLDFEHFSELNAIMEKYFQIPYPARVTVAVAALPRGAPLEIDAVMHV